MKNLIVILTVLFPLLVLGAGIPDKKRNTDIIGVGIGSSTDDKEFEFNTGDGANNVKLKVNDAKEGSFNTNKVTLGDGTDSNTDIVNDRAGTDTFLRYDQTIQAWVFSNDGAATKKIGAGGDGGGTNLLIDSNPDFDAGDPPTSWTASAGAFSAETTNPLNGPQSALWDPTLTGQFLDSALINITRKMIGRVCLAEAVYTWPSGVSGDIKMVVRRFDDSGASEGDIATLDLAPTATNEARLAQINFDCSDSTLDPLDDLRIRFESTTDAAAITIDDAFLGSDRNTANISQTTLVAHAHYVGTAACQWSRTNVAFGDFTSDSDCPSITVNQETQAVNTADNDLPDLQFDNLLAGKYYAQAIFQGQISTAATAGGWRIEAAGVATVLGTNPACGFASKTDTFENQNITCDLSFEVTSAGAASLKMQGFADAGAMQINTNDANADLIFKVWRVPGNAAESITLETSGGEFKAIHEDDCLWTNNSATYAEFPGDATCTFTSERKGGVLSIASLTESSNNKPGLAINVNRAMTMHICATSTLRRSAAANDAIRLRLRDLSASVTIAEFKSNLDFDSTNRLQGFTICQDVGFAGPGIKNIEFQARTGSPNDAVLENTDEMTLKWSGHIVSESIPGKIFTDISDSLNKKINGIPGSTLGTFRIASAIFNNSGTPALAGGGDYRGSGTSWIASIVDNSTGNSTVNFTANVFGGENVTCVCSCRAANRTCIATTAATATTIITSLGSTGAAEDLGWQMICWSDKGTLE